MDKEGLKTVAGLCNNLEELIRCSRSKKPDYLQQKILLDLYMSVINFQDYYKKNIGD